jgi:hypothetical protein
MSKRKPINEDAPRRGHARAAGDLVGDIGGMTLKKFGFVQSSVVSRWREIVGERYGQVSLPESIRFPAGRKSGGTLTLLVEGAHAPLIQHLGPMIMERVNRFFGIEAVTKVVFRQGRLPAAAPKPSRPQPVAVPQEVGENLRAIADPELRACLEALAGHIAATTGPPVITPKDEKPIPIIRSLPK